MISKLGHGLWVSFVIGFCISMFLLWMMIVVAIAKEIF